MIKIVIDKAIPFVKGVLEPYCRVGYIDGGEISPDDVRDADALMVRTRTRCDAALLSGSPVRAIATATVGYDHIDVQWCKDAGIEVFTAAGCNARGVLQWLAAVLARDSDTCGWQPQDKTIGVVGTGNVGSLSAVYSRLWGFDVLCCDPPRARTALASPVGGDYVGLCEIASRCDIVTFHTPLTRQGPDATYHMAGKDFFASLNPGALVVNSARGEIVDGDIMRESIEAGRCRAAIDTWEHEPGIDRRLLRLTCVATPHIAGYTVQGKANATAMSVNALAGFFGLPLAGWYPGGVNRTEPHNISWPDMKKTIGDHFDIRETDARLREAPDKFELLRTDYRYRDEYF